MTFGNSGAIVLSFRRFSLCGFLACIFLICILTVSLFSGAATAGEKVSRDMFIDLLKNNHPVFEKETLNREIEEAAQQSFRGSEDWNLTSSLAWSREEATISAFNPDLTNALSLETGLSRQFWDTGGRLSATYALSRTSSTFDETPFFSYPDRFYENSIELQYSQPILKDRGGKLSRLQYDLKGYDVEAADIQSKESIEEFLTDAVSKYLDWVYLTEQKRIIAKRLELSRKELTRTQRKFKAFLVDSVEVIRSKDAFNTWRQNLGLVESQLGAIRSELSVLVQDDRFMTALPDFDLYATPEPESLETAGEMLRNNSRVLQILDVRKRQLERNASGLKNAKLPDLSLFAAVTVKDADEDGWDAFGFDKKDAAVGLQFSLPLENRTAKADYRRNRLQMMQLDKENEDVSLSLNASLASLHAQMKQLLQVLRLNRQQIESARQRTREEIKIYEQGRGDQTFVIMSRDNEESAKLTYAENALNYQKLWLQYQALMDRVY